MPTFTGRDLVDSLWDLRRGGERLRKQLACRYGARHVFLFRDARSSLRALLCALGGNGTAVLPAYTCIAVPQAVESAGWRLAFADIAAGDVNMTHEALLAALPEDARVVVLTYQFGIPPATEPILDLCRRRGLFIVEDAAAAVGARYRGRLTGTFGDAAIISFHFSKVVNAGRGGALLINDDKVAEKVMCLQNEDSASAEGLADFTKAFAWWGATRPLCYSGIRTVRSLVLVDPLYEVVKPRTFLRPEGFHCCSGYVAALASRQLDLLEANVSRRMALARVYSEALAGIEGIELPKVTEGAEPAWIQFPIFVERKAACYQYLLRHGVDVNWTFRYSCAASYGFKGFPNAERAARTLLGLPTYPDLGVARAMRICKLVRLFAEKEILAG